MINVIGYWYGNKRIPVIDTDGMYLALDGWDGFKYTDCFQVSEIIDGIARGIAEGSPDLIVAKPVYDPDELNRYENGDVIFIQPCSFELTIYDNLVHYVVEPGCSLPDVN